MCRKMKNKFWAINLFLGLFFVIGCGGGGGTKDSKADLVKDFSSNKASESFKNSVISIPDNLQLTSAASSGKKSKSSVKNKSGQDDSIAVNLYGAIRYSVKFSDDMVEGIKSFLSEILDSQVLVASETGVVIPVNDGSEVTAYMVEDTEGVNGENYKWKLSLYVNGATTPEMIFRFTFKNESAKGQMIAKITDVTPYDVNGAITEIEVISYVDVHFDGTENLKKLDIDYTADLTSLLSFAEANWSSLTEEQKTSLDIGRGNKASLRVQFDGTEYGVSGCGYAAGFDLVAELTGEDRFLGEDRSTFTFRAKSITGDVDGAKMDVAVPLNTLADVSTVWETDSFSRVFQEKLLDFMNIHLSKMIDETDDAKEDDGDDLAGNTLEEQRLGFYSLYWFFGEKIAIPTFAEHGNVMTATEFDNAVSFWGADSLASNNIVTVDDLNAIFASTDVSISESDKVALYYHVMAPVVIDYYQANPVVLTISDIEAILEKTDDLESSEFSTLIETIKHLINPAFFEKEDGFLGTFDGTNFYAYDSETNSLALGVKPSNFDIINALDLTDLEALIPNDVFTMVIEVK